jgi:hypothetical protein
MLIFSFLCITGFSTRNSWIVRESWENPAWIIAVLLDWKRNELANLTFICQIHAMDGEYGIDCIVSHKGYGTDYHSPGQPVSRILCTQVALRR